MVLGLRITTGADKQVIQGYNAEIAVDAGNMGKRPIETIDLYLDELRVRKRKTVREEV